MLDQSSLEVSMRETPVEHNGFLGSVAAFITPSAGNEKVRIASGVVFADRNPEMHFASNFVLALDDVEAFSSAMVSLARKTRELDRPRRMSHLKPGEWLCNESGDRWERGSHVILDRPGCHMLFLQEPDLSSEECEGIEFFGKDGLRHAQKYSDELNFRSDFFKLFEKIDPSKKSLLSIAMPEAKSIIDLIHRGTDVQVVRRSQGCTTGHTMFALRFEGDSPSAP